MTATTDFPHAETTAAEMLSDAIHRRQREGISLRKTAIELGYRQAVVLSHMLSGRVPIPVDRVPQFARVLSMDEHAFLVAVLEQRYPEIEWNAHFPDIDEPAKQSFALTLSLIAGVDLDALTPQQQRVMREVAADPQAERRWLSVHEVSVIGMLRKVVPNLHRDGLDRSSMDAVEALLDPSTYRDRNF